MAITKFIIKTTTKIIAYTIISTIALSLFTSPIITNELALTQMDNNNELYILTETYNKIRTFISITYGLITCCFASATIYDIYHFIKTKTNKGEN